MHSNLVFTMRYSRSNRQSMFTRRSVLATLLIDISGMQTPVNEVRSTSKRLDSTIKRLATLYLSRTWPTTTI